MEVKESTGLEKLTALLSAPTDAERQRIIAMGRQTGRSQLLEAFLTEQYQRRIAEKQMKRLMERGRPAIQNKPKIKKRKKR